MIYFDNSATTFTKPQRVIDAYVNCVRNFSYNPNRGNYSAAEELGLNVLSVRQKIGKLVGCDYDQVAFSYNCTQALNTAIIGGCKKNGHVIATVCEHNSVIRPLMEMKRKGIIDVTFIEPTAGKITSQSIESKLRPNTYMLIINAVSNVTGYTQDLISLGKIARKYNLIYVVDGAQAIGYIDINMPACGINALCFPAHKGLHAMQGLGVICLNNFSPNPIFFGGTGSDSQNIYQPTYLPDKLESGTHNTPAILALGEAIDWWQETKNDNLPRIQHLQKYLQDSLAKIPQCKIYSTYNNSGIVSFALNNIDSVSVGDMLSEQGIAVRCGLHCAPLIHRYLGTTDGLIRASLSAENTIEECDIFCQAIQQIAR